MIPFDSVLHVLVGGLVTLILFAHKKKGLFVLLSLIILAFGKELYDHSYILGHVNSLCSNEHILDILYTFLLFFLIILMMAFQGRHNIDSKNL
jgi:hypothetical protein